MGKKKCRKTEISSYTHTQIKTFKILITSVTSRGASPIEWHSLDILAFTLVDPIVQTSVVGVPCSCECVLFPLTVCSQCFLSVQASSQGFLSVSVLCLFYPWNSIFFYICLLLVIGHHRGHYLIIHVDFLQCPQTPSSHQLWSQWNGLWYLWSHKHPHLHLGWKS